MLLGYITNDWLTQIVFIAAVAGGICYFRTMRHVEREAEHDRQEKRAVAALQSRVSKPGQTLTTVEENG